MSFFGSRRELCAALLAAGCDVTGPLYPPAPDLCGTHRETPTDLDPPVAEDPDQVRYNHGALLRYVDLVQPQESLLLTKPLRTRPDVVHTGGKSYFQSESDPIYQRWLRWVQRGAPLD